VASLIRTNYTILTWLSDTSISWVAYLPTKGHQLLVQLQWDIFDLISMYCDKMNHWTKFQHCKLWRLGGELSTGSISEVRWLSDQILCVSTESESHLLANTISGYRWDIFYYSP